MPKLVLLSTAVGSGAARQRASDQEVISFLDGRVQELEQALQETSDKLTVAQDQQHKDKLAFLEKVCSQGHASGLLHSWV